MVAKIFKFDSKLFPAGSIAYHPTFRYCSILATKGDKRVISYQDIKAKHLLFKTSEVIVYELQAAVN